MGWRLAVALIFLVPNAGWAEVAATRLQPFNNGCDKYLLCDAQSDAGEICEAGGTGTDNRIYLRLGSRVDGTVYTTSSSVSTGTYSCNVVTSDGSPDDNQGTQNVNSSVLTPANQVFSFDGLFDYIWINCATITSPATVTATVLACPRAR